MILNAVMIDSGTGVCKFGIAGNDEPSAVFPNVIGFPKSHTSHQNTEHYIAEEAISRREALTFRYPMEHGIIVNWDDMTNLWRHGFSRINAAP